MTTKYNAQALMDEVQKEHPSLSGYTLAVFAVQRAIEQKEATKQEFDGFRQEVSKVMTYIKALYPTLPTDYDRFIIIPAPKPDPLMEVIETLDKYMWTDTKGYVECLHKALKDHGLEIKEKNDDRR